jgi:hypothetical protein
VVNGLTKLAVRRRTLFSEESDRQLSFADGLHSIELVAAKPSTILDSRLLCTKLAISRRVTFAELMARALCVLSANRPLSFT